MYLNSSRDVSVVDGWEGEGEGEAGGRRRVLKASQSNSLQKERVTEYSGRAVKKKTKFCDFPTLSVYTDQQVPGRDVIRGRPQLATSRSAGTSFLWEWLST